MLVRFQDREFPAEGPLTIGRDASCDLVCLDGRASRRHAEVRPTGSGWEIEDLGSSNGTFCDGVPVTRLAVTRPLMLRLGSPIDGEAVELIPESVGDRTVIETNASQQTGKLSVINHLVHDLGLPPRRTQE